MLNKKVIVVLGMHRSGTSLVSAILERLGVEFGSDLLGAMEGVNEKGFWEHRRLVEAHEELLHALGRTWYDITPLPDGWLESSAAQDFKRNMTLWIREEFSDTSLFGLKDPRMCLFLPLWQQIFKGLGLGAYCIAVERDPLEIAHSLMKRDGLPPLYSLALIQYYKSSIRNAIGSFQSIIVSYSEILDDYKSCFESVESSFHAGLCVAALDENAEDILDFSLRHNSLKLNVLGGVKALIHDCQEAMGGKKQEGYTLSNDVRDYLNDIQHIWKQKHNELLEMQEKLTSLGEEYAHAQSVVAERDAHLSGIYSYMNKSWLGRWLMRRMVKS